MVAAPARTPPAAAIAAVFASLRTASEFDVSWGRTRTGIGSSSILLTVPTIAMTEAGNELHPARSEELEGVERLIRNSRARGGVTGQAGRWTGPLRVAALRARPRVPIQRCARRVIRGCGNSNHSFNAFS